MKYVQLKQWHTIVGFLMAIPLITLATTGSLIIHNRPLGLREMMVNAKWLPGYQLDASHQNDLKDIKTLLLSKNGSTLVGTEYGLVEILPTGARLLPGFENIAINSIQAGSKGILTCTQKGAWVQEDSSWRQIYPGECKQVVETPDKALILITEGKGILISIDNGRHWTPDKKLKPALGLLPATQKEKPLTLTRFLLDIHTGHIFFGKEWKWLWVDMLAILGLMLSPTGLWLWLRTRKPKKGVKH